MKKIYLATVITFILFIFSASFLSAQIVFEKKYGGNGWESARTLEIESDGYMVLAHTTTYSAKGDTDVYLIRTNAQGEVNWTKTIGGAGHDIAYSIRKTKDGNYILGGFTTTNSAGYTDAWIVKVDPNGTVLWDKKTGGGGSEWILDIEQTSDNGYILVGSKDGSNNSDDAIVWKTDENGNTLWYKTFGGTKYDAAHSVKQTADGGYIFIGMTNSSGAGDMDFYVVKLKPNGDVEWSRTYGGADYERGQFISVLEDGYIFTGDTKSYGAGSYDAWLMKVNLSGDVQWTKTFGGTDKDITKMVQKTSDGGFIIAGNNRSNPQSDPNMWLIKVDGSGNQEWSRLFGGQFHEHCYFAKQTPDGGYIVLGHSVRSYTPIYNVDAYLIKLNSKGELKTNNPTGVEDISTDNSAGIFPNPNEGKFTIDLKNVQEIIISDLSGKVVYKETNPSTGKTIDLSNSSKGMYFLIAKANDTFQTKKLIIY